MARSRPGWWSFFRRGSATAACPCPTISVMAGLAASYRPPHSPSSRPRPDLFGTVVSGGDRSDEFLRRADFPARDQGPRHYPDRLTRAEGSARSIPDPRSRRTIELRIAAATPHKSAKASVAPRSSLAIAGPACAAFQGASDLNAPAASPKRPPSPVARIVFHGRICQLLYDGLTHGARKAFQRATAHRPPREQHNLSVVLMIKG